MSSRRRGVACTKGAVESTARWRACNGTVATHRGALAMGAHTGCRRPWHRRAHGAATPGAREVLAGRDGGACGRSRFFVVPFNPTVLRM